MTRPRQAVILAAGLGTRLAAEWQDRPKGFITIGERPIVEESIERLAAAGIADVVIVTGHHAEHYAALARRHAGLVRTVHNPRYAQSGSMYSLGCARELVTGPFLLLESDLVYEPRALATLLDGHAEDAILTSGPTGAGDEVWVESRDGRLLGMSKDRATLGDGDIAELVGITRVSAALFATMCAIADETFRRTLHFDYETGCLAAAGRQRAIACPLVPDLVWGEIDLPSQLARVRRTVHPEVLRRQLAAVARPGN